VNFLKKNCSNCGTNEISLKKLLMCVGGEVIRCSNCRKRFFFSSAARWFLAIIATISLPLFVVFFARIGFLGAVIFSICIQLLVYYFTLLNLPLKEKQSRTESIVNQ